MFREIKFYFHFVGSATFFLAEEMRPLVPLQSVFWFQNCKCKRKSISDSSIEGPFLCTDLSRAAPVRVWIVLDLTLVFVLMLLPLFTEWKLAGFFPLGGEIDDRSQECLRFIYKACTQNLVSLSAAETNNSHFSYSEFPSLLLVRSVLPAEPCCSDLGPLQDVFSDRCYLRTGTHRQTHTTPNQSPSQPPHVPADSRRE